MGLRVFSSPPRGKGESSQYLSYTEEMEQEVGEVWFGKWEGKVCISTSIFLPLYTHTKWVSCIYDFVSAGHIDGWMDR